MACSIVLPFWPASTGCLSWSSDNQIAVAGGESIAILTPRLKESGPNNVHWDTTIFKANSFTAAEILMSEPLSSENLSIGEELSTFSALAASWSWPGLARHRGCALAVLSSNHVLSIWAPEGKANISDSWCRTVVVNQVIREYYERELVEKDSNKGNQQSRSEYLQVKQRTRAFAWSSSVSQYSDNSQKLPHVDWGDQLLAVATEGEDVFILRLESPYNNNTSEWSVKITERFSVRERALQAVDEGTALLFHGDEHHSVNVKSKFKADYLAWSDWRQQPGLGKVASLAYTTMGRLFSTKICILEDSKTLETTLAGDTVDDWLVNDRNDILGPMRFVPGAGAHSLIAFGTDVVLHVQLGGSYEKHHLDGRWDEATGLALTNHGGVSSQLHIVSHLSSSTAPTARLNLPFETYTGDGPLRRSPLWQQAIVNSRTILSADYDLEGNVQERIWGIASSPLGDFIVTCGTLHPSDSIAYIINFDQSCIVNITWECGNASQHFVSDLTSISTPDTISAATMLFSLQRQVEYSAQYNAHTLPDRDALMRQIRHHMNCQSEHQGAVVGRREVERGGDIIRQLKSKLFLLDELQAIRAAQLADIVLADRVHRKETMQFVIIELTRQVLSIPNETLQTDDWTIKINGLYNIILSKLDASYRIGEIEPSASNRAEECKICQQPIPFESLNWARCIRGHEFSRCALTFLSIQEPGATKACEICGRQYLRNRVIDGHENETRGEIEALDVTEQDTGAQTRERERESEASNGFESDAQPKPSLLHVLFAACDICIYCGGKFTG